VDKVELKKFIGAKLRQRHNNTDVAIEEIMKATERYWTQVAIEEVLNELAIMTPVRWWQRGMWARIMHMIGRMYPDDGAND
jgi:hypothetical protein